MLLFNSSILEHKIELPGVSLTLARALCLGVIVAQFTAQATPPPPNMVHGTLIQINPNGGWSWYQDERSIVDQDRGEILVGSVASDRGLGGQAEDGKVQTTHLKLRDRSRKIVTHNIIKSYGGGDDHNVPAYVKKQDGNILAFYAGHNKRDGALDDRSYYRTFDAATQTWGPESEYHWWPHIPKNAPGSGGTTYSNVFQLSAEDPDGDGNGRLFNIARTRQSPHSMYSDDNGATWRYGGQLTEQPAAKPSGGNYVNGYYKYCSNGVDRIDIIATEYHPRDFNTSIYHAYIQGGKLYNSSGIEIDADIFDAADSFDPTKVPSTDDFTPVFRADGVHHSRAWNTDVQSYPDGSINVLFKTRAAPYNDDPSIDTDDQRVWFARFDPQSKHWTTTQLAKAGPRLFNSEQDYTGLGALDPSRPDTIYIATPINPISDTPTPHHEIYQGVTTDHGATWSWTAITENSSEDNLRPIVPAWDAEHTALLWWKGPQSNSRDRDTAVLGVILSCQETLSTLHYIDASSGNTTLGNGAPVVVTHGPSAGAADDQWHIRTGIGNGATVYTADELTGEDAPTLKTSVDGLSPGVYDVFACFWVDDAGDWCIAAGLSASDMMVFRDRSAAGADAKQFSAPITAQTNDHQLMQAYLGRVHLTAGEALTVFVDDHDSNADSRTWYDGIAYGLVVDSSRATSNNSTAP